MTDLVLQLVGALEGVLKGTQEDCGQITMPRNEAVRAAFAALTAAKAGGWVAVPAVMTDEMRDAGNEWVGNRFLLNKAYDAMLAARPTTPPKEQS